MNPKQPPNAGSFTAGHDDRRNAGAFKPGPDERRTDGQFKPGHDDRRSSGQRPAGFKAFVQALRTAEQETPDFLVTKLKEMLASKNEVTQMRALEMWTRWSIGPAPTKPVNDDDVVIPTDPKELQRLLEAQLHRRALEGDADAQLIVLRTLDPKKYGGDVDPDDKPKPPGINFTRLGQARPGHKPESADKDD